MPQGTPFSVYGFRVKSTLIPSSQGIQDLVPAYLSIINELSELELVNRTSWCIIHFML